MVIGPSWDSQLYQVALQLRVAGTPATVVLTDWPLPPAVAFGPAAAPGEQQPRSAYLRVTESTCVPFWRDRVVYLADRTPAVLAGQEPLFDLDDAMLRSWIDSLACPFMVNDPARVSAAQKPKQLRLAAEAGIAVPRTLLTADPQAAAEHFSGERTVVIKPLASPLLARQGDTVRMLLPAESGVADLARRRERLPVACFFQERLRPVREWRVVVVGGEILAASIHRADSDAVDWRQADAGLDSFEAGRLPEDLARRLLLLTSRLGLAYAAIDLLETAQRFYFLEANPDGTFAWLERASGLRITEAVCRTLVHGKT